MSEDAYEIQYLKTAVQSLKKLDKPIARRILQKLDWLAENALKYPHKRLSGDWSDFYRYRVGDYRVIYALDNENCLIIVEVIGHHREIYDE